MYRNAKIIIVDDHIIFREVLKLLIETEGIGEIIAEADNGLVFLNLLEKHHPDLVLMDLEMPVMGGLEATFKARAKWPDLKILVLTMNCTLINYTAMLNAGAMGFILKTSGIQELKKAIKTVIRGKNYFANEVLLQIKINFEIQQSFSELSGGINIKLSNRELEILQYFCNGLDASEISEKLVRSIKTIEAHRSNLIHKTNTKNTINLMLYAFKNKLVQIY